MGAKNKLRNILEELEDNELRMQAIRETDSNSDTRIYDSYRKFLELKEERER